MVELAVSLPLLVGLAMSTIETCRFLFIKQSVKMAAYECARLGIVPGATEIDVQELCTVILQSRKIKNFTVSCSPSDLASLTYGTTLSVTVDLPLDDNMLAGSWLFTGKRMVQTVNIMAEYGR